MLILIYTHFAYRFIDTFLTLRAFDRVPFRSSRSTLQSLCTHFFLPHRFQTRLVFSLRLHIRISSLHLCFSFSSYFSVCYSFRWCLLLIQWWNVRQTHHSLHRHQSSCLHLRNCLLCWTHSECVKCYRCKFCLVSTWRPSCRKSWLDSKLSNLYFQSIVTLNQIVKGTFIQGSKSLFFFTKISRS